MENKSNMELLCVKVKEWDGESVTMGSSGSTNRGKKSFQ